MVLFDIHRCMLINGETCISLTKSEAACLQLLLAHPDAPVSRDALLASGWKKKGVTVTEASVRVTLHHLRKSLVMSGVPSSALTTMLGKGYRLESGHVHQCTGCEPLHSAPSLTVIAATPERSVLAPGKQRTGWRYSPIILLLTLTVLLSIGAAMLRMKDFIKPVEYVALSNEDGVHLFAAPDYVHLGENSAAIVKTMFAKKYIPVQDEYWIYINNTYFKERFSALICSLPLNKSKNSCYTLNLLPSDG